jgi:hypothetical protein
MEADWESWLMPLCQGILHVVDSGAMAAVLGNIGQPRTNGNRHLVATWDEDERAIRYTRSEGTRLDGSPLSPSPSTPLVTKLLAFALADDSLGVSRRTSPITEALEPPVSQFVHSKSR